jgi:hypothetical protein
MAPELIQALLDRKPFLKFQLELQTDGDVVQIQDPANAWVIEETETLCVAHHHETTRVIDLALVQSVVVYERADRLKTKFL